MIKCVKSIVKIKISTFRRYDSIKNLLKLVWILIKKVGNLFFIRISSRKYEYSNTIFICVSGKIDLPKFFLTYNINHSVD